MTKRLEIYKCSVCGNIIEVLHAGPGQLVCCNKNMDQLSENTVDAATEKHVPVIEQNNDACLVKVGSVPHPMEDNHYIEWVEVLANDKVYRKFLKPGVEANAVFKIEDDNITAREYCNLHGLWKA